MSKLQIRQHDRIDQQSEQSSLWASLKQSPVSDVLITENPSVMDLNTIFKYLQYLELNIHAS